MGMMLVGWCVIQRSHAGAPVLGRPSMAREPYQPGSVRP